MKKIFTLILFSFFSPFLVAQTFTVGNVIYNVTAPTEVEVGLNPSFAGALEIPETVENEGTTYTVTSIADLAFSRGSTNDPTPDVTILTMPNTIRSIGARAFIRNTTSTITFSNTLETIGELAFFGSSVTDIELPATLVNLGDRAFDASTGLTNVTIAATTPPVISTEGNSPFDKSETNVEAGTLFVPAASLSVYQNDVNWSVQGFGSIEAIPVVLPDDFTAGGITYKVTSLDPNEVEVTADPAFTGALIIPETVENEGITYTVTGIGDLAFSKNDINDPLPNITSVVMPNTIRYIGARAFIRNLITSVTFSNTLETIGDLAFFNAAFSEITLPSTLATLGDRTFGQNTSLNKVVVQATTPPTAATGGFNSFQTSSASATLFVPTAADYTSDADWSTLGFSAIESIIPVTGVSLNESAGTIEFGSTVVLTATVEPMNATIQGIVWTSDDETVATVVDGTVEGVGLGMATITATTVGGSFTETFAATVSGVRVASVMLDDDEELIEIGSTYQLTATVLPAGASDKSVTWSSSDEAVATVSDEGLVTGVAKGTATITVTTTDGSFTDTFTAMVPGPPVESVSLDDDEETIVAGETYQLTATVLPEIAEDKSVMWSSDNESVATVSDAGLVTGVDAGTATITVTTVDGGRTATFVANVIVGVASVELNDDEERILVGGTYALTATVLPANATDKSITWRSSNETVATVSDQGVVTGLVPGQSLITVTTVDGNLQDTFIITVETILSVAPGIEKSMAIYPNPATSSINLIGVSNATLVMYDLSGSIIIRDQISQGKPFSLPVLEQGIYLVKVIDNENSYQTRLVIE